MSYSQRILLCAATLGIFSGTTNAAPLYGTKATGSDLEPVYASLSDGGPGKSSASVTFSTFHVDAQFDPLSTYLPILRAESQGIDATFDDDRTNTKAEAYQVFTSSVSQSIRIDIALDSVVTNGPSGTSGVLSNIYVIGGSGFGVSDTYCNPGQFTFDGTYLCGSRIAKAGNGLSWSNLYNGGSAPTLTDYLEFDVTAGDSFGIYASLSAGSFQGTADAFNTLSLSFEDDTFIRAVPELAAGSLFSMGLLILSSISPYLQRIK